MTSFYTDAPFLSGFYGDQIDGPRTMREVELAAYYPDTEEVVVRHDGSFIIAVHRNTLYTEPTASAPRISSHILNQLPTDFNEEEETEELNINRLDGTIYDTVSNFLYYDRKADEELPLYEIQAAIAAGTVTVEEIVDCFARNLRKQLVNE
jgi:hypothetical protein